MIIGGAQVPFRRQNDLWRPARTPSTQSLSEAGSSNIDGVTLSAECRQVDHRASELCNSFMAAWD
jgi:hypothetical protein